MSNFTKSIFYSTFVLAAGLVAIFAIYNNVTTNQSGSSLAEISPAAGEESAIVIEYDEVMNKGSDVAADATTAVLGAAETVGSAINGAVDATEETLAEAGDMVEKTMESLAPAAGEETTTEAPAEETPVTEGEEAATDAAATEDAPAETVEVEVEGEEDVKSAPAEDAAEAPAEDAVEVEAEEEHTEKAH